MKEYKQEIFDQYMNEFIKLNINQKNNEIIEKQKIILALLIKYAVEHDLEFCFLKSNEIIDILDNLGTADDYLEAMMVYTENIEEIIGTILNNIN